MSLESRGFVAHNCQQCGKEMETGYDTAGRYNRRKYCDLKCAGAARRSTFIEHGTSGGYQRCRLRPEGACASCRAGQTKDCKERQVHRRAVAALIELYPDEYRRLREQLANLRLQTVS